MTQPFLSSISMHELGKLQIRTESDVIKARHIGIQLAKEVCFDKVTCIGIGATIVELGKSMVKQTNLGEVFFELGTQNNCEAGLIFTFSNVRLGIKNSKEKWSENSVLPSNRKVGLNGTGYLMDDVQILSESDKEIAATLTKWLPQYSQKLTSTRMTLLQNKFKELVASQKMSMIDIIDTYDNELQILLKKLQEKNEHIETIHCELIESNKKNAVLKEKLTDCDVAIENTRNEAQIANKTKNEFLANMSHEIRTPMNAILGFTEVLENKITDKTLLKYLSSISSSGKALLNIINDILDLSKIEAGKLDLQYEAVNLFSLIYEVGHIFEHKTKQKEIDFILEIDSAIPQVIFIDDVRLRQILFNLIGNAVKFTDSGFVKLSVKKIVTNKANETIDLLFLIEDSGIGIPENNIRKIFGAFEQQKNQNINKYGGTGLGLTITQRLVNMMGGHIKVESNPGKGSMFNVYLNNLEVSSMVETNQKDIETHISDIIFEPASLLVVDDIAHNRELIVNFLEKHKLEIYSAENGKEAIDIVMKCKPDLILMDLKMPVMDGFEATSIIKSKDQFKSVPIIALTASAMQEEQDKILNFGFDHFIHKPVSQKELIKQLAKYLSHKTSDSDKTPDTDSVLYKQQLSTEILVKVPGLIQILEGNLKEQWQSMRSTFILKEINDFALEIKKLANEYEIRQLSRWSEKIVEQTQNFDMENLSSTLNQYENIISSIKKLMHKGEN